MSDEGSGIPTAEEWRARLRCWGAERLPINRLGRVLQEALCRLPSPMGDYVRRTALGVSPVWRRGLLPLPVEAFALLGGSTCHGAAIAWSEDRACWYRVVGHCVNYLGSAFGKSARGELPPLEANPVQKRAMAQLARTLDWFLSEDEPCPPKAAEVLSDALGKKFNYCGDAISVRRELVSDKVFPAWPDKDAVGILQLEDFLPEDLRAEVLDPWRCLRPIEEWPQVSHRSRVYASQEEWDRIAREGLRRGIFQEVAEDQLFRGRNSEPVLSGAMGVDKFKEKAGVVEHPLRFITIMTPLNGHMRDIAGEVAFLPYIAHSMLIVLGEHEEAIVDSEDFVSCFNLVRMPAVWAGFMAYSQPVSGNVLGRGSSATFRVGIATVPMGWSAAVAVIQAVVRRLVFGEAAVDVEREIAKCKNFPPGPDFAIVYLDSFEYIRVRAEAEIAKLEDEGSPEHARFVAVCSARGLPLNAGKALVGSYRATLQGGEFDGQRGLLGHGRKRGRHLIKLTLGLCGEATVPEALARHWAGLACFAATYRRPLFSILGEIFGFMETPGVDKRMNFEVVEEMLVFAGLLPLAVTNLRAQVENQISCSDASPTGGGDAIARKFSTLFAEPERVSLIPAGGAYACPGGCGARFQTFAEVQSHREQNAGRASLCEGDLPGSVLAFLHRGGAGAVEESELPQRVAS